MPNARVNKFVINMGLAMALTAAGISTGYAASLNVLYSFNPSKAWEPRGNLLRDGSGNLFGAAYYGGKNVYPGYGAIYEFSTSGQITYLYNFCKRINCADGSFPVGPLVQDSSGNLYGVASSGGNGGGVVFELSPQSGKTAWNETVLYGFSGGNDGGSPNGGLIMGGLGNLYGTTQLGGLNGGGTLFQVSPAGNETVVYNFPSGANPQAGLIIDNAGNLYGTTNAGGLHGHGDVFEVAQGGVESELYSFCPNAGCSDGANPAAALIMDNQGNLYGTTFNGGNSADCVGNGCGVVFELSNGVQSVLHAFSGQDGSNPGASLYLDGKGNIYGTTQSGGRNASGVAFEITNGSESVLWNFCKERKCVDGIAPSSDLIPDNLANFYGVAAQGGKKAAGVLFQLTQ
jgi:uncharacterized repeat protein (TIGR03803 family)